MEIENKIDQPVVEDRVELKFVQQPTRDLLERYFAEKVHSLKVGLDEVWEPKESDGTTLTQLESIKAYWNICRTEMDEIVTLFGEINPKTMNPNHRKIMVISRHFNKLLQSNPIIEAKRTNNQKVLDFARWSIDYITALHTCLDNNLKRSPDKVKANLVKSFVGIEPYAE